MKIRKIISVYFNYWWIPVLITGIPLLGWLAGFKGIVASWHTVFFVLWMVGMIHLLASIIYQLSVRRWARAILSVLAFGGMLAAVVFIWITVLLRNNLDGDHWADHLSIPANIPIEYPMDLDMADQRPDSMLHLKKGMPDFQLYHSFQPGLFQYDAWLGKTGKGTIYLKAWEITQPFALSVDRLPESSALPVENTGDTIRRFASSHIFTIYEGDWGKPYAARFELWYKPADGGPEQQLMFKNYVIEGWQR